MVPASRLSPEQLHALADDAFVTMNWAKRAGMNKACQIEETIKAFEITLGYRVANQAISDLPSFDCPRWPSCGCPDGVVDSDCPGLAARTGGQR